MEQNAESTWWLIRLSASRPEMVTIGPTPEEAGIISAHFEYIHNACQRGDVLMFGRTANNDEETMGLCVFRAPDEAEARAFMENDPAVRSGVMNARLFPYRLAGFNAMAGG